MLIKHLVHFPPFLLLTMSCLISLMLLLAKYAIADGLNPINYTFWQTLIAGMILLIWRAQCAFNILPHFKKRGFSAHVVRYAIISGLTGVALPNIVAFMLVSPLGIGNTNLMYALPPVFTLLLSALAKQDTMTSRKVVGIVFVCLGSAALLFAQGVLSGSDNPVPHYWYALGLIIPISLAAGNVYRIIDWPKPLDGLTLAALMLLGAALCIAIYAFWFRIDLSISLHAPISSTGVLFLLIQIPFTALTYVVFFQLQRLTSPVYVSQIGAVSAVIGSILGVLLFDEFYSASMILAIVVVLVGVMFVSKK